MWRLCLVVFLSGSLVLFESLFGLQLSYLFIYHLHVWVLNFHCDFLEV